MPIWRSTRPPAPCANSHNDREEGGSMNSNLLSAVAVFVLATALPAPAQSTFPFDQEMLLEVKPMPGSRRVPMLEVQANGRTSVDLWCHSAIADVAVSGNEIKFTFLSAKAENCTPERAERDEVMGKALSEVTHWSRQNDIVTLTGPGATYRFRISTH
jgi:hypothetical protein